MASRFLGLVPAVSLACAIAGGACGGNVVVDPSAQSGTGAAGAGAAGVGGFGGTTTSNGVAISSAISTGPAVTAVSSVATVTATSSVSSSSGAVCSSPAPPPPSACSPKASCSGAASPCLAPFSQATQLVFGLRMEHLAFSQPAVFAKGTVASILGGAVMPNVPSCNLDGTGTFSWLLRFDYMAGTLTTGGAKPVANPAGPYTFDDKQVAVGTAALHVAPVTLMAPFTGDGCKTTAGTGDMAMEVYLDAAGTQSVLLPMHQLSFPALRVSADHACIGTYDPTAVDPSTNCQPGIQSPFIDEGSVTGYFLLSEADLVPISTLSESLCVLLSGNQFADGASPIQHCKKNASGQIAFQGDFCSATNGPATPTCHDAVQLSATFAASAVHLN